MSIVISALSADSYVFTLFENGQVVGVPNEAIELGFQGYEDTLLMAYVWIFENKALGSIAIGVVGEENLATNPGSYTGKADVFLTSGNATINGATVDCTVVTK